MTSFILCLFAKGFINVIMRQGLWLQNGYDKLMQPPTTNKSEILSPYLHFIEQAAQRQEDFESSAVGRATMKAVKQAKQPAAPSTVKSEQQAKDWLS